MTRLIRFLSVLVVASAGAAGQVTASPESACKASLTAHPAAVPEGVSLQEMEAGCTCMAGQAAGNAALEQEIITLSEMTPDARDAAMSDELRAIVNGCFPMP